MFSFVKNRSYSYIIAGTLFVASLLSPFILPVHQGIDLTGGIQMEYSVVGSEVENVVNETKQQILQTAKSSLSQDEQKIITDMVVYTVTGTKNFIVEAGIDESAGSDLEKIESAKQNFVNALKTEFDKISDTQINNIKYVNIGASFGEYIKTSGYLTLTLAVIGISFYIMYAFSGSIPGMASWPFAVVTALSLLHDVIISFGLYILTSAIFPEFKIDTFFFTAMLTVLGYSINDTIVIMDKVRSTMKTEKNVSLSRVIDDAIHSTMRRSIFTSLTIFIVLVAMFIWGPTAISGFVLVLIFGVIVGTYSSVFLAAPALVDIIKTKK